MKRVFVSLVAVIGLASLLAVGCTQAAPSPTATKAPAVPTKAAEPTKAAAPTKAAEATKAPTAAPTSAPAKKVDFPTKGRTISIIVPLAAGGTTDTAARVMSALLEKELGTTVQIVNKPGASQQVGNTELVQSKPDGYTLIYTVLPSVITTYLDPERKAIYTRTSFQPVGTHYMVPFTFSVQSSSPLKNVKDLVDTAKAQPEKIKFGTSGLGAAVHLPVVAIQKAAAVKFAIVHFEGSAPQMTALLGGHTDVISIAVSDTLQHIKSGAIRILGVTDKQESRYLPGVPTVEAQGYKGFYFGSIGGISAPAGTPRDVVDVLSAAMKKVMATDEHKKKMDDLGFDYAYMGPEEFGALWAEKDAQTTPLMDLLKEK